MSNTIPPFVSAPVPDPVNNQGSPQTGAPASPAATAQGAVQTESVTLSAAAQTGTQLLTAARQAAGVDQAQIAAIRAQLANGSYNVSPQDLAQAIATVLKDSKP